MGIRGGPGRAARLPRRGLPPRRGGGAAGRSLAPTGESGARGSRPAPSPRGPRALSRAGRGGGRPGGARGRAEGAGSPRPPCLSFPRPRRGSAGGRGESSWARGNLQVRGGECLPSSARRSGAAGPPSVRFSLPGRGALRPGRGPRAEPGRVAAELLTPVPRARSSPVAQEIKFARRCGLYFSQVMTWLKNSLNYKMLHRGSFTSHLFPLLSFFKFFIFLCG